MKSSKTFVSGSKKVLALGSLAFAVLATVGIYAATTTLNMQVIPGSITIGSPTSLSFSSTAAASDVTQSLEQAFNGAGDYFYIQDLKGADNGYSTTLQASGPLTAGTNTIPLTNMSFKAVSGTPTLLSGTTNPRVTLNAGATSYQDFSSARTFMVRANTANNGVISKYGSQISLKVDIPGWQAVGTYTTSLVFTLIEN